MGEVFTVCEDGDTYFSVFHKDPTGDVFANTELYVLSFLQLFYNFSLKQVC
jgi:hypothetical protein